MLYNENMSTAVVVSPKKIHKVVVDRKACIGAATCVILAPKAFEMDDENIALVRESAHEVDDDTLLMAAQSCPTGAIILYDDAGKQIFPKEEQK